MTNIEWHDLAKKSKFQVFNFINGDQIACSGMDSISNYSPRDGSLLYEISEGTCAEVDMAVISAKAAFEDGRWWKYTAHERKLILNNLANLIEENQDQLALFECLDTGKPITNALTDDIPRAINTIRNSAENIDKVLGPFGCDGNVIGYQLRKPVGVVAGIIGWNFPLWLATQKVGPALAMGNSLVLKPSEQSSLSTWRLAELALEAGVPEGVFNVVNGAGKTVGDALAHHRDVDLLTFVGSSDVGKQMMVSAGQSNMKRLILECGGKSPFLVFDDCSEDLDFIAADIVETAFFNQGAVCGAGTRVLLQKSVKDKLMPKLLEQAAHLIPSDPLNGDTNFGALINESHMNKVLGYIESGEQEGATLIYGGNQVNQETGGYYIEPTIFDNVDSKQKIAKEEIFGPVLSVFTFEDEKEAISLANDTCFGLAAYAATQNVGRVHRLGQGLNAGHLAILSTSLPSSGSVSIAMEGHKESGFGFEGSLDGLKAYTVSTTVNTYV